MEELLPFHRYTSTGEITVSADVRRTHQGARELFIVVSDTGIGIPDEIQDRAFEPFFRAPRTPNRKDGLGLVIVKALVIKLGGRVELQSRAGKGTTVIVVIPLVN